MIEGSNKKEDEKAAFSSEKNANKKRWNPFCKDSSEHCFSTKTPLAMGKAVRIF